MSLGVRETHFGVDEAGLSHDERLQLYLGLFGRFDCDGSGAVDLEEFRVEMREVMLVVANGLGFRPIQMVVEEGSFLERAVVRESSAKSCDRRDDPQLYGHIIPDLNNSRIKVDFPRWEEGDPIRWIACVERYFRFYRTVDATRVEMTAIHLEGDAIQCLIGLSTPMEVSLGNDSRKDY
ncbi:hypothetical protein GW17_00046727 [Ensete ventricosum]|nr:hypothetical protein GW17_00046727 [Ensete ventricosum]